MPATAQPCLVAQRLGDQSVASHFLKRQSEWAVGRAGFVCQAGRQACHTRCTHVSGAATAAQPCRLAQRLGERSDASHRIKTELFRGQRLAAAAGGQSGPLGPKRADRPARRACRPLAGPTWPP